MRKRIPIRTLLHSGLFLLSTFPGLAAESDTSFTIREDPEVVHISTSRYDVQVPREGIGMSVTRDNTAVLDLPPASTAASGRSRMPRMRKVTKNTASVTLDYEGARMELHPSLYSIEVTVWYYQPGPATLASLRWRLDRGGLWYGGGFQGLNDEHVLPLNNARVRVDSFVARGSTQGTPVWYSTNGVGVHLKTPQDFRYSINQDVKGEPDGLFSIEVPGVSSLNFELLIADNARELISHLLRDLGWPRSIPPYEYMRLPIYTTWTEYKGDITQEKILAFAALIQNSRLPCGVIEIDMGWETKCGDLEFDRTKFPDPKAMIDQLHAKGLRVTLWVSNFVNTDSEMFQRYRDTSFFARDLSGNVGLTGWWAGFAAVWDYTNPRAASEFRSRLIRLQRLYGVDGFKFDSGEANLVPRDLRTYVQIAPMEYADYFNREAVSYFPWHEARVGVYSQATGIVQRLQDKQSSWSNRNGLTAMISQVFTLSLRGFFHVMPDIVGGNEYGSKVEKELLIRWAQASALMPFIQFSKGPWHFDEEAVRLVREAAVMHIEFSPYMYGLAELGRDAGEPPVAPLWYHYPNDPETFALTDQYMLGKEVLIAPVLKQGALSRDIYLPAGKWTDWRSKKTLTGGVWHRDYPAPLDTLPVFVREGFVLPRR